MHTRIGLAMAALVLVAGCGGGEVEQIASDACDLLEEAVAGEDMEAFLELQDDMQELGERAEAADVSDEDLQQAMQDECPSVIEDLEGLGL